MSFHWFSAHHRVVVCAVAVAASCLTSARASAVLPGDLSTSFPIDDNDPLKGIPKLEQRNGNPLEYGYYLQDLISRAEPAFEKGDWERAIKYYEVLGHAEPNVEVTFSRLCMAYAKVGRFDAAAANCGRAVSMPGALVIDHLHFVEYTLQKPKLLAVDVTDADASLAFLREHLPQLKTAPAEAPAPGLSAAAVTSAAPIASAAPAAGAAGAPAHPKMTLDEAGAAYWQRNSAAARAQRMKLAKEQAGPRPMNVPLEIELHACQLATRLADAKRLDACVTRLRGVKADDRIVLPYEWTRALVTGDETRAKALIAKADTLGFPADAKAAMLAEQEKTFASKSLLGKLKRGGLVVMAGASVLVLLALGLAGWALMGLRRRKVESESPV